MNIKLIYKIKKRPELFDHIERTVKNWEFKDKLVINIYKRKKTKKETFPGKEMDGREKYNFMGLQTSGFTAIII